MALIGSAKSPAAARTRGKARTKGKARTRAKPPRTLSPWEAGLWNPSGNGAIGRNRILTTWGHRANVVLADGVENEGYVAAVIGLNAK